MKAFLIALLVATAAALACGPFFQVAVFTYQRHPDFPRTAFLDGKLGVLLPGYARSYLVVAYRHLTGVGFDPREREQVLSYWTDRGTGGWDKLSIDWRDRWIAARNRIPGVPKPKTSKLTQGAMAFDAETKSFALNCTEDAFRNALHTLAARSAKFGTGSEAVREWTAAQTQVFSNCDGLTKTIPPPANASLPETIRKDRDYQIAAAHFYARDYAAALKEFEAIANDTASPWRTIAPYLAARTLTRADLGSADARARQILTDPKLASTHGMTYALLRRIMVLESNPEYFRQLTTLVTAHGQGNGLREEIWEFTRMYDKLSDYHDWQDPNDPPKIQHGPIERDDLPDWIASFQGIRPDAEQHAYARWKSTKKPHWLMAAISRVPAKSAHAAELIDAAGGVAPDSPAYLTVTFHRLRLMVDDGQGEAAKPALDALLNGGTLPKSAVNLFKGLRMRVAPDLSDFLRLAQRVPVLITDDADVAQQPSDEAFSQWPIDRKAPRLDADSVLVLNQRAPLSVWKQVAQSVELPEALRGRAQLATFTRAIVLGDEQTASAMASLVPALAAYKQESSPDARPFAAAYTLLRMPEAQPYLHAGIERETAPGKIDNYIDNWWCAMRETVDPGIHNALIYQWKDFKDEPAERAPESAFLSAGDSKRGADEHLLLLKAGGASAFLGKVVLSYARKHAEDPRIPEALHLAVRAARYACDRGSDSPTTGACFRLLHSRYPNSEWAKKTPTWYGN